jgi:hypothetical protein
MTRSGPDGPGAEAICASEWSGLPEYNDTKARVTRDFPDVPTGRL